jgi:hypothetical protein
MLVHRKKRDHFNILTSYECVDYVAKNPSCNMVYSVNKIVLMDLNEDYIYNTLIDVSDDGMITYHDEEGLSIAHKAFESYIDDGDVAITDDMVVTVSDFCLKYSDRYFFISEKDAIACKLDVYAEHIKNGTYNKMVASFIEEKPEMLC